MKKYIFILLLFLGIFQLGAETVVQIYPPSLFEFVAGRNTIINVFKRNENDPRPSMFDLPIDVRQTIAGFNFADLMVAGGLSFYFEDNALNALNLSAGLTFGYGYKRENEYFFLFRNTNLTIYPIYEYPISVSPDKIPGLYWKFAVDMGFELIQVRPLSISMYYRVIGLYAKNSIGMIYGDVGLTLGLVF
jgi:hypothetical protein